MMRPEELSKVLSEAFPEAEVRVQDMTGTGDHFELFMKSPVFKGKSLVEQHQMVYKALGNLFDGPLHALKIRTSTPDE